MSKQIYKTIILVQITYIRQNILFGFFYKIDSEFQIIKLVFCQIKFVLYIWKLCDERNFIC